MHRSLALLRISEDERELRSRTRLFRLYISKHLLFGISALFFFGVAVFSAVIAYRWTFITPLRPAGGGPMTNQDWLKFWGFMGLFVVGFGAGGLAFAWGIFTDPILKWLRNPGRYVFALGQIVTAQYIPGERRSFDRMRLTIEAEADGLRAYFLEDFQAGEWLFRAPKPMLPAYVLIPTDRKASPALVGIPAAKLDKLLAAQKARSWRESRLNWIMLGVFIATAVISIVARILIEGK